MAILMIIENSGLNQSNLKTHKINPIVLRQAEYRKASIDKYTCPANRFYKTKCL